MLLKNISKPLDIEVFSSQSSVNEAVRTLLVSKLEKNEILNIAISGGSTPLPVFKHLGENPISNESLNQLNVFWVDERFVPQNDPRNNYNKANKYWLRKETKIGVFPIKTEKCTILESTKDYETRLPVNFQLILLGMGDDGHIASLFPNQKFQSEVFHCVHSSDGTERVSINHEVIVKADEVVLLIKGSKKLEVLNEDRALPIHNLLRNKEVKVFYLE
jgi:6-phosphogluconolactonase